MSRTLFAIALGASLIACAAPRYAKVVESDDTSEFGIVKLGGTMKYLVDPRTQTCLLVSDGFDTAWAVSVSCARLKANVPAAARFITWDVATQQ